MGLAASRQEAFWEACGFGHTENVKTYIESGCDVNWVSHVHNSCAIHVASQGKPDIVQILLDAKCDVNVVDERGALPIHHAAMRGYPDIMKMLISAGSKIDIPDKNGWTPLIYAAYYGKLEPVEILLKHKVMVNLDNKDDRTALHEVCRSQCEDEETLSTIARTLIEAGCELDKKSSDVGGADFTPLMYATYYGHSGLVRTLCEAKCDINLQGSNGYTALHWGVNKNNKECVAVLLEKGANPLIKDKIKYRPVDRATTANIKTLLRKAAEEYKARHGDGESSGSEGARSPVSRQSSTSVKFERQTSMKSNSGNVGDLVKYMLLGTDKDLEKKKESSPPLQSPVTNGMNDLTLNSNHDDEIGFMDDDPPTSSSASPQRQMPSSSSMTSSDVMDNADVNSTTDSENNPVLESKSEIESSEKAQKKPVLNGTSENNGSVKKLKNKNVLLDGHAENPGETGSEFDSELDETGFVEDLRDSDAE